MLPLFPALPARLFLPPPRRGWHCWLRRSKRDHAAECFDAGADASSASLDAPRVGAASCLRLPAAARLI